MKLYVPAVSLSAKYNRNLSITFSKRFKRRVYQSESKTKRENKNPVNAYRQFFDSNIVGVRRVRVLVYTNQDENAKRFNAQKYCLPKGKKL